MANNNWLHKSIHHIFRDLLAERKNRNGGLRSEIICRACCSKKAEDLPRSRRVAGRLPPIPQASIPLLRWAEDYQQWGGGGAPPLGAFNPPPHLGGQRRARLWLGIFGMISKFFFEILRPKFVPLSLFLSPQGPPGTANPAPKSGKVCFFRFFEQFFRAPKRTSILTSKNNRKIF